MPDSDSYTELCKSIREIVMNMVMSLAWRHSTLEKSWEEELSAGLKFNNVEKLPLQTQTYSDTTQEQNFLSEQTALPSPTH